MNDHYESMETASGGLETASGFYHWHTSTFVNQGGQHLKDKQTETNNAVDMTLLFLGDSQSEVA